MAKQMKNVVRLWIEEASRNMALSMGYKLK